MMKNLRWFLVLAAVLFLAGLAFAASRSDIVPPTPVTASLIAPARFHLETVRLGDNVDPWVFLLDTQTGRVWKWTWGEGPLGRSHAGYKLVYVEAIDGSRPLGWPLSDTD